MPGRTPYRGIRYPLWGETVNAVDIQNMATDMNTALTTTLTKAQQSRSRSGVHTFASSGQTVAKATDTYANLAVPDWDTGLKGPGAAAYWASGTPSRLTAPVTGLYLFVCGAAPFIGVTTAPQGVKALVRLNGTTLVVSDSATNTTGVGVPQATAVGIQKLNAGDYLEFGVRWSAPPAGPVNYNLDAALALMAL